MDPQGNREYQSLCLPCWSCGGQECPDGSNRPTGSQRTLVVRGTPPRNASEPLKPLSGTYLSLCLPSWSCGGQECPDGSQWTQQVLENISYFGYSSQKCFYTPRNLENLSCAIKSELLWALLLFCCPDPGFYKQLRFSVFPGLSCCSAVLILDFTSNSDFQDTPVLHSSNWGVIMPARTDTSIILIMLCHHSLKV